MQDSRGDSFFHGLLAKIFSSFIASYFKCLGKWMAFDNPNKLAFPHTAQGQKEPLKIGRTGLLPCPHRLEREWRSQREACLPGPCSVSQVPPEFCSTPQSAAPKNGSCPPPLIQRTSSGTGREDCGAIAISQISKLRLAQSRQSNLPKTPSY